MQPLKQDDRFRTNTDRVHHRSELKMVLTPSILKWTRNELMAELKSKGVPAGSIRNMKEVFEWPQAQKMILEETFSDGQLSKRVGTIAFKIT